MSVRALGCCSTFNLCRACLVKNKINYVNNVYLSCQGVVLLNWNILHINFCVVNVGCFIKMCSAKYFNNSFETADHGTTECAI